MCSGLFLFSSCRYLLLSNQPEEAESRLRKPNRADIGVAADGRKCRCFSYQEGQQKVDP